MTNGAGAGGDAGRPFAGLPDEPAPVSKNPEGYWELCAPEDVPSPGARGFVLDDDGVRVGIVVVRQGQSVRAYVNRCPHLSIPLNLWPDRFLSPDGQGLQCATHGARFRLDDGFCTAGPCKGRFLQPFPLSVKDRKIVALEP
ncbi:Rieske (2Fe-2S) protein [Caenispirillum salinarum]|uniref:Rieske (2Fe-2S) protein n=1 Tax=Caenispirillum salinarum TaxID=859058 RepID=UPI0038505FFF